MKPRKPIHVAIGLLAASSLSLAVTSSCGKKDSGDDKKNSNPPEASGGQLQLNVVDVGTGAGFGLLPPATGIGQASTTHLESLQYFIQDISICQTATINGSGYNNKDGCITLYEGDRTPDYNTFNAAEADADTDPDHWIDLMDATSRAKLNKATTVTAGDAREYNYGFVNWYRPIKVKAKIPIGDGSVTLSTKAADSYRRDSGTGIDSQFTSLVTGMTSAGTELVTMVHSNGGSWFKFQKPFVITEADIESKASFDLDLVFNPEGIIKGQVFTAAPKGNIVDEPNNAQITVPMLDLTPVARKSTDKTVREKYLIRIGSSAATATDIRLDLYYLQSDTEKTVYGVESKALYTSTTTNPAAGDPPKAFFVETGGGGSVTFLDWQHNKIFVEMERKTVADETGTVATGCALNGGCDTTPDATTDVTYRYLGDEILE